MLFLCMTHARTWWGIGTFADSQSVNPVSAAPAQGRFMLAFSSTLDAVRCCHATQAQVRT